VYVSFTYIAQHANNIRLHQKTAAKSNRRGLEIKNKVIYFDDWKHYYFDNWVFTFLVRYEPTDKCMRRFIINIFSKSPVKPERRPYNVSTALKKLQIAEVRAEQSLATLWIAVETLWRNCDRLELHVAAFILNMLKTNAAAWRLQSVLDSSLWGLLEHHEHAVNMPLSHVFRLGVCNAFWYNE